MTMQVEVSLYLFNRACMNGSVRGGDSTSEKHGSLAGVEDLPVKHLYLFNCSKIVMGSLHSPAASIGIKTAYQHSHSTSILVLRKMLSSNLSCF